MSDIVYIPIIKTGDAEIRAIEALTDDVKDNITPIFELTRSRKSKNIPRGDVNRRLNRLGKAYGARQFIIDLTVDPNLSNRQVEELHSNRNGYRKWVKFLILQKEGFPDIVPVMQISDEGVSNVDEFYERIRQQVESLEENFDNIVYRFPLNYNDYKADLDKICKAISGDRIICVVDAEFIPKEKNEIYSSRAVTVVRELTDYSLGNIALTGTSFHRNPTEYGGEEYGEFHLEEWLFYQKVDSTIETDLIYGDYATVNPTRSMQAGGRGWVPRIDMPTEDLIFYYRSRRLETESSYAPAYIKVAKRMVNDERYRKVVRTVKNCWGIEQIELAAEGYPQGLSPSFWISVRMNIHMTLRLRLL